MYDLHMEEGLVISLQILLFLNDRSIVNFFGCGVRGGGGVTELVIFCGRRKCMVPNSKE